MNRCTKIICLLFTFMFVFILNTRQAKAQLITWDPGNCAQGVSNIVRNVNNIMKNVMATKENFSGLKTLISNSKKTFDVMVEISSGVRDSWKAVQCVKLGADIVEDLYDTQTLIHNSKDLSVLDKTSLTTRCTNLINSTQGILSEAKGLKSFNVFKMTDGERMKLLDNIYNKLLSMKMLTAMNKNYVRCYSTYKRLETQDAYHNLDNFFGAPASRLLGNRNAISMEGVPGLNGLGW